MRTRGREDARGRARERCFLLLLAFALLGCSGPGSACGNPPAQGGRAASALEEGEIREAVFRYLFRHNESAAQDRAAAYFLTIGKDQELDLALVARFAGNVPPVKPLSACRHSAEEGVIDLETRQRGLIFRVEEIRVSSEKSAEVVAGYDEASLSAAGYTFQLSKRKGEWIVVGARMNWIS